MDPSGVLNPPRESSAPWKGKSVVLGVCGGVASYKVVQVARDLALLGARVDVVFTDAARHFVTPLAFEGVTGRRPITDPFSAPGVALHVKLAREADCVCVAPATADFIARAAAGRASDLPATLALATEAPVVIAPSMNHRMFAHPQTQANLSRLEELGYRRVGPGTGKLAAGEGDGRGRMAEPRELIAHIGRALAARSPLAGAHVLVTAGPTREPLDSVRYIGNRSSGRMGYALAAAAWRRGAKVTLVTGPSSLDPPAGADTVRVETAVQMREAVLARAADADVAIYAAAVADYRPGSPVAGKIKRRDAGPELVVGLVANPDVAAEGVRAAKRGSVSVGFALETSSLIARAGRKMAAKGFDVIVANRADQEDGGFESRTNRVVILQRDAPPQEMPLMRKAVLADKILDRVEEELGRR